MGGVGAHMCTHVLGQRGGGEPECHIAARAALVSAYQLAEWVRSLPPPILTFIVRSRFTGATTWPYYMGDTCF